MVLKHFLILIFFNFLISGEIIVLEPSEGVGVKFLMFNVETDVVPHRYHVEIDLGEQLDFQYFNGTSKIRFLSRVNSEVLHFHFNKSKLNEIYAIRLTNIDRHENIHFERVTHFWLNNEALIGLELDNGLILQNNTLYDLYIEYMVKFTDEVTTGFFKTCVPIGYSDKSCYVTTHFESFSFRETVPSFDVIGLKSKFSIEITHNCELKAISNMPGNTIERNGNLVTTHFEETPLMSTYIVAFTVGKFRTIPAENLTNTSINIYIHHANNASSSTLQKYSGKLLHVLENYLNASYTLPKLDLLVTRTTGAQLKGMENWGLITLDETSILEDVAPSIINDENALELLSHEIAHQFFGNLVTMKNITYLWLNEGFASYFSYRMLSDLFPKENFMERIFSRDTAITQWVETALPITVVNDFQPRAKPNRKMYVYPKGCVILNVLAQCLGEEAFQSAMRMYINKFSYGSVTPDDLIDVFQEVNNIHHTIPSNVNIREFINSWINQNRFPILTVIRNYTTGEVVISQSTFKANRSEPDQIWLIPFNYATKSKPNFWNTLPDGWLTTSSMTLQLNLLPDDWIIFNKQQSGNYIVNYDVENWRLITEAMVGEHFELIPPIERARTISDAHFLSHISKNTNTAVFFNLLPVLKKDRSRVTWDVIDRILKIYLTKDIITHFHIHKLDYFKPVYDYLGFEYLDGDSREKFHTKIMITNWACYLRYDKCLNDMNKLSEEYLRSIESDSPLVLDQAILKNLFQFGFSLDAAFEQISIYVHNSSNAVLKEIFYSDLESIESRPHFQLHYMLTKYNLSLCNDTRKPAILIDKAYFYQFNEFNVFSLCVKNICYDFNENCRTIEERKQLIDSVLLRVIRKVEKYVNPVSKINKLFRDVEIAYNVHINFTLKSEADLKILYEMNVLVV